MINKLKFIFVCNILAFSLLFSPILASAEEISSVTTESTQKYYKVEDTENDSQNQFIDLSNDPISDLFAPSDTKSFTYDFINYVRVLYNFVGRDTSKITFNLTTTTWSNSDLFYVKMYTTSGTLKATKYVYKSYGNPTSVYFYLPAGDDYYFRFENSNYGQRIVGSGSWTLTN